MRYVAILLTATIALGAAGASTGAAAPVRLSAKLGAGAQLGKPGSVQVQLRIDHRYPSVARELYLSYPAGLDLVGGGLGLASCQLPAPAFEDVLLDTIGAGSAGCSPNALVATGRVFGEVRLDEVVIGEIATLKLMAGELADDALGVVGLVEGTNPFGALLAYAGKVTAERLPYEGTIGLRLPRIAALPYETAEVALLEVDATIGGADIIYERRGRDRQLRRWRPAGVLLPSRCPRRGLPFKVKVAFANGATSEAVARAACPRRSLPTAVETPRRAAGRS